MTTYEYISSSSALLALVVSALALVSAWNNGKKTEEHNRNNLDTMKEQLKQNIFPDIVLCHKRVGIPIDKLNPIDRISPKISIPMANVGKSTAKNFGYSFDIKFKHLEEITNDISNTIPNISFDLNKKTLSIKDNNNNNEKEIKFKATKFKLISFILPIQDGKNVEEFNIYSDYVDLLRILLTFIPELNDNKLPILHIHLYYEDIDDDKINKSYKLTPKIKERCDHKIKLLFKVSCIKNDSPQTK
ncbi:MAG: hypothetical protein J6577_10830 [Gilliamella sp.]|nr:hypothetical protein [Gilliamella sp.]